MQKANCIAYSRSRCLPATGGYRRAAGAASAKLTSRKTSRRLLVRAAADGGDGAGGAPTPNPGGDQGPQAVSLLRRFPGPEVTFVLAGFLKILTLGGLASSAPVDAVRTAAGKLSPYLLVPFGLAMCWVAKIIVDNELQENKRFMTWFVAGLVFLYFAIYRMLFRYDPRAELPVMPRATSASRVAQLRAQLGDRELGAPGGQGFMLRDSRAYVQEEGRGKQYDDLAYYDGRYASQVQLGDEAAAGSAAVRDARNPARQQFAQRRA